MSDLVKIPEDLQEQYKAIKQGTPENIRWTDEFLLGLIERIAQQDAEIERLKAANELDRRYLWATVREIDEEITGRMWLLEGRGSYEWDDDKYRQEFGWAVHALQEKLEPLRKIAHDLTNCPETEKGVDSVRKMEATVETLKGLLREMEEPVTFSEAEQCLDLPMNMERFIEFVDFANKVLTRRVLIKNFRAAQTSNCSPRENRDDRRLIAKHAVQQGPHSHPHGRGNDWTRLGR